MFYLLDIEEKVGVEAQKLKKNIQESIEEKLEDLHLKEENGVFLGVVEIKKIGETGEILPEKPYIYFNVAYTCLFFQPVQNEIVEGYVTEVAEFGPFVRIGPIDALVHISQITKEKLTYNPEQDIITSKDSKIIIKKGDFVIAMVANSSISEERIRVNLTMKQEGLGLIKLLKKSKKKEKKK
ncbi:MAG TPA: DNA-directed RNA polymerase [Candidatus Aenigmarchaeota archaeon]|nr:MAG: DNA-directed RNA polymerase [Candidatus Aenigmarchaeota archaeon]HDI06658.1 DNA-directed RNA polymerase [Candidatus Aenigmarchaeota archaeon]